MGVIDTLSAGFSAVNRRLWIVLLPVALDLFLWLGPRLSAESVLRDVVAAIERLPTPPDVEAQPAVEVVDALAGANIFSVLTWQLPSLVSAQGARLADVLPGRTVIDLPSWGLLLLIVVALGMVGLALACAYMTLLALTLRGEALSLGLLWRHCWTNFARFVGYLLLLGGGLIIFGLPTAIVLALVQLVSPALAGLLWLVVLAAGLWLWLYLFFVSFAIFVGGYGPLKAVERSVRIVAGHFWQAFGVFSLIQIITIGTTIAWGVLLPSAIGVAIAIIGNAYILTGLTAGAMRFFWERDQAVEKSA